VAGRAAEVWARNADTVQYRIYGPHFEDLARQWCLWHADPATLGGSPSQALPTVLPCREHRQGHELDVVVWQTRIGQPDTIIAIGEAKATAAPVGGAEVRRLEHLRDLLPADAVPEPPRLLLFARSGFTADVTRAGTGRDDLELIDLDRLYTGT
jgi:hypothetical protein